MLTFEVCAGHLPATSTARTCVGLVHALYVGGLLVAAAVPTTPRASPTANPLTTILTFISAFLESRPPSLDQGAVVHQVFIGRFNVIT
jgi:hypothetical protein